MLGLREQVAIGDLDFDVWVDGPRDGEPVVLLHGFPQSASSWSSIVPTLVDAGFRTIVPNQRGYSAGARPVGAEHYATELLARDVVDLADALDLGAFHLVGHDWGAAVAWVVAATWPDRVRTLTAVSVPHLAAYNAALRDDADAQEKASYIRLFRTEGKAEEVLLADDARRLRAMYGDAVPPARVAEHLAIVTAPGALTAALGWYRGMGRGLSELPDVSVPTTFVWSDGDMAIGRHGADRCGEHVSGDYRYVVLEGVSHWVPEEAPDALVSAVLDRVR